LRGGELKMSGQVISLPIQNIKFSDVEEQDDLKKGNITSV
jgi:hypothetical protein